MSYNDVMRTAREHGVPMGALGAAFAVIESGGSVREAHDALLAHEEKLRRFESEQTLVEELTAMLPSQERVDVGVR
jgi:hypothetical protein